MVTNMVTNLARQAMTTQGQKACLIIDHLVEALANDASSSIRRAMILVDIDQNPGTSQAEIMERLRIDKSTTNREIQWMFNYGCIIRTESNDDARSKDIQLCGYSKAALDKALVYFGGRHENLKGFLKAMIRILRQEKPTLREAKIINLLTERGNLDKKDINQSLYEGSASTKNRVVNKLLEDGILEDA